MISYSDLWTPKLATILWRGLAMLLLTLLWFNGINGVESFIALLLLAIVSLARWRFALPSWAILLDQFICVIAYPFWPDVWYAMALPLFESTRAGKIIYALPIPFILIGYAQSELTPTMIVLYLLALFVGWVIRSWSRQTERLQKQADQERRDRYELEALKTELLTAHVHTAHMAELTERYRISQKLHDDVGHELTAALLALQAFEQLWKEDDPLAGEMFDQAQQRLSNSASQLRETVHNMIPVQPVGIHRLEEICRSFTAFPIHLQVYGDTSAVPAYHWNILEPCLKEALTNAARHANATHAEAALDVSSHIVRLSVYNDGVDASHHGEGVGLRNLRQRARAAGGSVTTDGSRGFRIVCVLPLGKELFP
ncbi:sensor histidine kinase [Paenibacillaceae bacterium]|nr:sensor histidine kinase [Paenibacillaceae bacterium]